MLPSYISSMCTDTTRCLSLSNVDQHNSVHANDLFLHLSLCNGFEMAFKLCMDLRKYCIRPKNDCTYFTVVGTGHSLKFHTFESLMHIPAGMTSKPKNIVLLYKKLHFLILQ